MTFKELVAGNLPRLVDEYAAARCFRPSPSGQPSNPWRHPLEVDSASVDALVRPVSVVDLCSQRHLALQRLLLAIYEQDLCYLGPVFNDPEERDDYEAYYDARLSALGRSIRPWIEEAAFSFLDAGRGGAPAMSPSQLYEHMNTVIAECDNSPVGLVGFIGSSVDPGLAARSLLIQIAVDALNEASALGRTLLGVFGAEQCALMSVFMDEYGLGKFEDKHGTLFEHSMTSAGLSKETHAFYYAYLPTSIAVTNYFHYLCSNRQLLFRYIGALYYLEATMPHFAEELAPQLKDAIGPQANTRYLDEHAYIDPTHKRVVFESLVVSSVEKYGARAVAEIHAGFEAIRVLQQANEVDYRRQVEFALSLRGASSEPPRVGETSSAARLGHIEDLEHVIQILEGDATIDAVGFAPQKLAIGQCIRIPSGRLYTLVGAGLRYVVGPA